MTSIPASRNARAITLAPRSWPSRPGLAMTTLSLRISLARSVGPADVRTGRSSGRSDDWHFLVFSPHLAKRVAHLADRRIGADRVEDWRHQVVGGLRGG